MLLQPIICWQRKVEKSLLPFCLWSLPPFRQCVTIGHKNKGDKSFTAFTLSLL